MTDVEILDTLIDHAGSVRKFAEAVGVSRQSVWEWREGMTVSARVRLYLYAEDAGIKLPKDFLRRALG